MDEETSIQQKCLSLLIVMRRSVILGVGLKGEIELDRLDHWVKLHAKQQQQ